MCDYAVYVEEERVYRPLKEGEGRGRRENGKGGWKMDEVIPHCMIYEMTEREMMPFFAFPLDEASSL